MLDIDSDHRLRKFNAVAFNNNMNSKDFTEVVRCELIVKKCWPILLCVHVGVSLISEVDCYRMHVANRKILRYICKLPLWAHLSELLCIFNIEPISTLLNNK